MLSAHEVATLLLLKDAPERIASDCAELGALRELQLIANAPAGSDLRLLRVTPRGDAVLRAFARVR
ncbi:hypothetical protein VOM14_31045 [Paraburkholderia sp. MPAMCS5]|uniref:hypothetical protein n=1 Tax=Paraburkholderia sp. MPAMCS5 TaxID=3112563 RepID=UPI002E19EAE0|nr:hypothetical protein [Paraburkholderia sp. MPAMCS5]